MILIKIQKKSKENYPLDFIKYLLDIYQQNFEILAFSTYKDKFRVVENQLITQLDLSDEFDLIDVCINSIQKSIIIESSVSFTICEDPVQIKKNPMVLDYLEIINDGNLSTISTIPICQKINKLILSNLDEYYEIYQRGVFI